MGIGVCGDWCLGHRVEDAFISGLELALATLG
jgi:predicted NAD/FAD-dependent oxidoreductase